MLNQTFNPQSLNKLISDDDINKYSLGNSNDLILNSITAISYDVSQISFSFKNIKKRKVKNKDIYYIDDKNEYFAIKKLNSVIKRLYTISHSNRNDILKPLIDIIKDGSDYKLIRADVKDFFGMISRKKIINKIRKDSLLGSLMIHKLNQLDEFLNNNSCLGLPRGLSISSTLSELYLRGLDSSIKSNPNVYYYARYVDDIIIVCLDNVEEVSNILKIELKKIGLSVNDKYKIIDNRSVKEEFDYLGVKFNIDNELSSFSLSTNKVKEMKTRIIKSILDYKINRNNELLFNRIIFLTSNYNIHTKTESNNLKAGIYYNNQYITDYRQLSELNEFLRKSFTAKKGSLAKVVNLIPKDVIRDCISYSFFDGYMNKRIVRFSNEKMANIVRCWNHG